jgi:uncharacterized membrane protein
VPAIVTEYLLGLTVFFGLDMIWLGFMASRYYKPVLGDIALQSVNLSPAIIFYLLYPAGLVFFAIEPALKAGSWRLALLQGALFGFFSYATYDLSNQATLRNWSAALSGIDIAWGTVLGAVTALLTYEVVSRVSQV